jgi:hypothetical protein
MKSITYNPCEGMNDTIEKYGADFKAGQTKQIDDELAKVLLTCPYFDEQVTIEGEVEKPAIVAPKKRKRRTKAEMQEALENEQKQG